MATYTIFDDMMDLRDLMDGFFSDMTVRSRGQQFPHVRIFEGNDALEIQALVPGVAQGDLSMNLVDTSLIIEGDKKSDYADRPYIRKERTFGRFQKSIKLPYRVDAASIKAELKNGVLRIHLAKSEEAKPRKIEITEGR